MKRKAAPKRLIPKAAAEAADRIAARVGGDPATARRLMAYVAEQVDAEASTASAMVRQAVREYPLSREELCRRTGVEPAALSRFMAGTTGMNLTTFEQLAGELGLRVVRAKGRKA